MPIVSRPPIVSIMGHVNHGKTSLLDAMRLSNNETYSEYGGITQKMNLYYFKIYKNNFITILDTPGHEVFTLIRNTSAEVTDLILVVISADEGVKKQTLETLYIIKKLKIHFLIVITKTDLKNVKLIKIKNELNNLHILKKNRGNIFKVSIKNISSLYNLKKGIIEYSKNLDLKVDLNCRATGVVIEYKNDPLKGPAVIMLLKNGILKNNSIILIENSYFKARNIFNDDGRSIRIVTPSMPIFVTGIRFMPRIGSKFIVIKDKKHIKNHFLDHKNESFNKDICQYSNKKHKINLIIRSNLFSSLEVIHNIISNIKDKDVFISIIRSSIGNVTHSDIKLANITNSIIICFGTKVCKSIIKTASFLNVVISQYFIVYNLIHDIKKIINSRVKKCKKNIIGKAKVSKIFFMDKGTVAGCFVMYGYINYSHRVKLVRNKITIYSGSITTLKKYKQNVDVVNKNDDFGISIKYTDIKKNDEIYSYT